MKTFSMIASVSMLALVFGLAGCKSYGSGSEEVILSSETKACGHETQCSDCTAKEAAEKAAKGACTSCAGGSCAAE
ncbi:MAG: hypothetical protein RLN76_04835 [Phycisphaeraceae bacterium]